MYDTQTAVRDFTIGFLMRVAIIGFFAIVTPNPAWTPRDVAPHMLAGGLLIGLTAAAVMPMRRATGRRFRAGPGERESVERRPSGSAAPRPRWLAPALAAGLVTLVVVAVWLRMGL